MVEGLSKNLLKITLISVFIGFLKTKMILVIWMNLYIWSHSADESDKEEYIKISRKCCIECMPDYTYGGYIYLNNSID